MNCLRCNTPNEEGAKFCKNCGFDMTYVPNAQTTNSNQSINYVLIAVSFQYFVWTLWFILEKVIVPKFYKKDGITDWDKVQTIYKPFGWTTDIAAILVLLIFAIIVKNKTAKIFLFIFTFLRIVFVIGYRLLDQ